MVPTGVLLLLVAVSSVVSKENNNLKVDVSQLKLGGFDVQADAKMQIYRGSKGKLDGTFSAAHVFGGPDSGAQYVSGGVKYNHKKDLSGSLDVSFDKYDGTSYSASAKGQTKLGLGFLSWNGGVDKRPGKKPQTNFDAEYNITF